MERTKKEYGGYLPFELRKGKEYYSYPKEKMQRYNSAKTAIYYACQQFSPKTLWAPQYLCPNVKKTLQEVCGSIQYYNIDKELKPIDVNPQEGDVVFLVNYFGVMVQDYDAYLDENICVILDNSHDFYQEPVMKKGLLNVYSCKKFFGVPDGGYLIGEEVKDYQLEQGLSGARCDYLLGSYEQGTNAWYARKKEMDKLGYCEKCHMSEVTCGILKSIVYDEVRRQREKNYELYQSAFGMKNQIPCRNGAVPYMYPLNAGKDIRKELVEKKIYVPLIWEDTLDDKFLGTWEYDVSKNTLFLPLDQRYDEADIRYIISQVEGLLR